MREKGGWERKERKEETYVFRFGLALEVGFDGFVLFVELSQVRNKVFDDVGVWKRVDASFVFGVGWNAAYFQLSADYPWPKPSQRRSAFPNMGDVHKQAKVLTPSIFIAQLPQMPSRQLLLNVSVGSISFLILISASNIMGPVLVRSKVYDCIFGFSEGLSGDQR